MKKHESYVGVYTPIVLINKRGITIIALVVTIIVLLVLAGVSISFIFGNEGIFSKTQTAAEKYKNAQEQEDDLIAKTYNIIDSYVNGNRDIFKESSLIKNCDFETESFQKYINININVSAEERNNIIGYHIFAIENNDSNKIHALVTTNNSEKIENLSLGTEYNVYVVAYDKYNNYKISEAKHITTQGKTSIEAIPNDELINYFGKKVRYNGDNNWSILYIGDEFSGDGRHMYLISKTSRKTGKPQANGNYNDTVLKTASGRYLLKWAETYASSNNNSNGASKTWSMLTGDNNNTYCDSDVAEWAISGPTVDLYFKAYNMKKNTSYGYNSNYNSTGYNYSMAVNLDNPFNLTNTSFWFSSPGSYGNGWVMALSSNNTWCYADKDGDSNFNPVVCLKKTAKFYEDGDELVITD